MIRERFRKFIRAALSDDFLKNVATLSSGVIISQIIMLLLTPVISRVYETSIFGEFALLTSNASIITTFICLGLMSAIMLPRENETAQAICSTLLISIFTLSTLLLLATIIIAGKIKLFECSFNYYAGCVLLYLYILSSNISALYYAYINRQKLYKVLFLNPIIISVVNCGLSILFGILGCGIIGYALGSIVSQLTSIIFLSQHGNPFILKKISLHPLQILKEYKQFPIVVMPSAFISNISMQIPLQMIARLFSSSVVGSYSMAMRILQLPTNFLAAPINRVFYKEAAQKFNDGENIGEFSFAIIKANTKIALIPIAIISIFAEPIFSFILGNQWREAGTIAAILATYEYVIFCNSCISGKFVIIGKQKTILILNIVNAIMNVSVFTVCGFLKLSHINSLIVFAISGSLFSLLDLTLFMRYAKINLRKLLRFYIIYLAIPISIINLLRYCFLRIY